MRHTSPIISVAFVTLALVISACSQTDSESVSDLHTFMEVGTVYDAVTFEQALADGVIGGTASEAVVPLIFTRDGELLERERASAIFAEVHQAASEEKAMALLDDAGVSLYFTTTEVYTSAVARLEIQGRLLQGEFNRVRNENVTSLALQSFESSDESTVFIFNPYTTSSLSVTSVNLQPTQDPNCLLRCSQRCSRLRVPALVIACFVACVAFC